MTIFLISLAIFSGAFYLSLRYDDSLVTLPGSNTTSPGGGVNSDLRNLDGEGRLLHEVYVTGLRSLTEAGSVLNYYEPSGSFRYTHICTRKHASIYYKMCSQTHANIYTLFSNLYGIHSSKG